MSKVVNLGIFVLTNTLGFIVTVLQGAKSYINSNTCNKSCSLFLGQQKMHVINAVLRAKCYYDTIFFLKYIIRFEKKFDTK